MNNNFNISVLSFDQDWAPDFICNYIADILISKRIKSTWFITNESSFLDKLRQFPELFELGIHPNFLPNSSHGNNPVEVIETVKKIVPEAKCSRSHAVFQYGGIIQSLRNDFSIEYDLTSFLYEFENIYPTKLFTAIDTIMYRLPVFWSDDHEFMNTKRNWVLSKYKNFQGIKVFSFHPIHVYLNSSGEQEYENYKQLTDKTENSVQSVINKDIGAYSAFLDLVAQLQQEKNYFISELKL